MSLTQFTEEQLLGAVGDSAIEKAAEDANFSELVEAVGRWIQERIENDPDSLPATFMLKMYLDGKKAISARQVADDSVPEISILDRIDALPAAHAIALLRGELSRLASLTESYTLTLERLVESE